MATSTDGPGGVGGGADRVRVDVRTDDAVFDDLAPHWDQLLVEAADGHPYLSRAWAQAWWSEFGRGPTRAASRSMLHVVAVWRGDRLVALYPMLALRVGAAGVSVRMLVGIGHENADYGGALVRQGDDEAMGALVAHLEAEVYDGRTVVNLTRMCAASTLLAAMQEHIDPQRLRLRSLEQEEYPLLDLTAFDDAAGEVQRLLRRNDVLRRARRLAESGEVAFVSHHVDPAGTGLDEFLRVHDLRWRGRSATGPFASKPGRRFLRDVSGRLEAAGLLRLSLLTVDKVPIAGRYGTVFGGWYQGMKSAWDPRYAAVGPGHLIVGRLLEQAAAEGLAGFDFLRGGGHHKEVWANAARTVGYWTLGRNDRLSGFDDRLVWTAMRLRYRWRDTPTVV